MSLVDHAQDELKRAGFFDKDGDYAGALGPHILNVVKTFSEGGHSGGSAAIAMAVLERLLAFKPLTPLTGADDEWADMSEANGGELMLQNKRAPYVFKYKDGYFDTSGAGPRKPITFPYMPE